MNTIVLNTLNGAVTEYTNFPFDSITPTHAGNHNGLYELGGNTDAGTPIVARVTTGKPLWGSTLRKWLDMVFIAIKGNGNFTLTVNGETASHTYSFAASSNGVTRAKPGRGIRENYLSFGVSNPSGQDFQLDRIEVKSETAVKRRTK